MANYGPSVEFAGARFKISPIGLKREFYLTGDRPRFNLEISNLGSSPWSGRVLLVWAQGTAHWVEGNDVALSGGESATIVVQNHWLTGTGMLECRLPMDKTPLELASVSAVSAHRAVRRSHYTALCSVEIRDRAAVEREEVEGFRSLYGPFSAEALSYVALAITTIGIQLAVVVGAISNSKLHSVPWPLFLIVLGAVFLSFVFVMASMARFELLAQLVRKAKLQALPSIFTDRTDKQHLPQRFMRGWFAAEGQFFGQEIASTEIGGGTRAIRWVSSGRVLVPLAALAIFCAVVVYILWPHVIW